MRSTRSHRWILSITLALLCLQAVTTAPAQERIEVPADVIEILGATNDLPQDLRVVMERPPRDDATVPVVRRVHMAHVAEDRYVWALEFDREFPRTGTWALLYLDADNNPRSGRQDKPEVIGTDVHYSTRGARASASVHNRAVYAGGAAPVRGTVRGNIAWIADDIRIFTADDRAQVRLRTLVQSDQGGGDSSDWLPVSVPVNPGRTKPELPDAENLAYKGLLREEVEPAPGERNLPERRPTPPVPFDHEARAPEQTPAVARRAVTINLLEEAGVARAGELMSFGMPFEQGALFDPGMIRVLDADGGERPAQATVTSWWPDGSIRWALVETLVDMDAGATADFAVEFGAEVARAEIADPVQVSDQGGALVVSTGPLQATISRERFTILDEVRLGGQPVAALPEGIVVVREGGKVYRLAGGAPDDVRVEKQGPLATTVRLEGPYVAEDGEDYLRAIVRLTFVAGSPTVHVAATHIDDYLETEFTDIESLTLPVALSGGGANARFLLPGADGDAVVEQQVGPDASLIQKHDALLEFAGEERENLRASGVMDYRSAAGAGVIVAVENFWEEYPKALSASADAALIQILPPLAGESFYEDLPDHLSFPFVEGHYRFKWGMSKTTRMSLTFHGGGAADLAQHAGQTRLPVVPVIPAQYYAGTAALGDFAPPREGVFEAWDALVAQRFEQHMQIKESQREYGFFNYGDWFGERGTNWGNNEYDLPHGLFMQYARTGERDYFRLALEGVRHMADVDCVHAHPDPLHVGAMQLHSVGHTGEWSQNLAKPGWSYRYGYHTTAANGHTWADGLMDGWYLAGDPRVMEAGIGLGEHVAFAMAPTFDRLGTHERSAGWSMVAIMAIYRATGDPVYLQAAERILQVALDEQDLEGTGAWPHLLPSDHAAGYPDAVGNVTFLIGVLLGGMQAYHQETGDPQVLASMEAAMRWVRSMYIPDRWVFHYTSSPHYLQNPQLAGTGTTMLVIGPVAYVAEQTGDRELLEMVAHAFAAVVRDGGSGNGKSFAQSLFFASPVMAAIDRADPSSPAVQTALRTDPEQLVVEMLRTAPPADRLQIREPLVKEVLLLREGDDAFVVTAERSPYGARTRADETGTVQLIAPGGEVIAAEEYDTDSPFEFVVEAPADGPRGVYTVRISDDMRSVWDVNSSQGRRVVKVDESVAIGGVGIARWALYAPPGTTRGTVELSAWHSGRWGGMLLGPDGEALASEFLTNAGEGAQSVTLQFDLGDNPAGTMLDVVLQARMDIAVRVEGIPPYLATGSDEWFNPEEH
ncbi:MAG: hypothetical protein ACOX9R_15655 [Armatimonadota bacterium]|jgi:hypothetical protein